MAYNALSRFKKAGRSNRAISRIVNNPDAAWSGEGRHLGETVIRDYLNKRPGHSGKETREYINRQLRGIPTNAEDPGPEMQPRVTHTGEDYGALLRRPAVAVGAKDTSVHKAKPVTMVGLQRLVRLAQRQPWAYNPLLPSWNIAFLGIFDDPTGKYKSDDKTFYDMLKEDEEKAGLSYHWITAKVSRFDFLDRIAARDDAIKNARNNRTTYTAEDFKNLMNTLVRDYVTDMAEQLTGHHWRMVIGVQISPSAAYAANDTLLRPQPWQVGEE